jgi:hypothetical protein
MPSPDAAVFCTHKIDLEFLVEQILEQKVSNVSVGKKWFDIVASNHPSVASKTIWDTIETILKN